MPRMKDDSTVEDAFANLAGKISQATGSFWTFSAALLIVLVGLLPVALLARGARRPAAAPSLPGSVL